MKLRAFGFCLEIRLGRDRLPLWMDREAMAREHDEYASLLAMAQRKTHFLKQQLCPEPRPTQFGVLATWVRCECGVQTTNYHHPTAGPFIPKDLLVASFRVTPPEEVCECGRPLRLEAAA